jgi:hypothetical protein
MSGTMPVKKDTGSRSADYDFGRLSSHFALDGTLASAQAYGSGHIHETFRLRTRERCCPDYILQHVNHHIFGDIPSLMENIVRVTGHMRRRLASIPGSEPEREALTVVPAKSGMSFFKDDDGECWRCFRFIEHRELGQRPGKPCQASEAGRLFGRFLNLVSDLPAPPLHEIIPRFHDVDRRLDEFRQALAADPLRRREAAGEEIAFVGKREAEMKGAMARAKAGGLALRVTHNDTKFNNVLFDSHGRGVCVIDLDTVMPGYILYDFGDAIRSAANTAREDETDLGQVHFRMEIFEEFAASFLGELRGGLHTAEAGHLAFAPRLLTFIIGLRFLTDHLAGDRYFKTVRPDHNLQRTRVQFRLLTEMERCFGQMEEIIGRLAIAPQAPENGIGRKK